MMMEHALLVILDISIKEVRFVASLSTLFAEHLMQPTAHAYQASLGID